MAIGDQHELNGYRFRETLHGPFVAASCVDCGGECYVVQRTGRTNVHGLVEDVPPEDPRCATCGRRYHGAPVKVHADKPRVQHGIGFPGRLDPDRLTRAAEVKSPTAALPTRGLVEEWQLDDPRLPVRVAKFIAQLDGARVCHTVSSAGGETIGVHLPGLLAAMFERREVAASVRPRKVDLKRTKTGRRKVQRFDPIVTPAHTDWPSYVLVRAGRGLVKVTVTRATEVIRQRAGS